ENRGVSEDSARAMLNQMVDPQRRLLRFAGGGGGKMAYSLGHHSLGPPGLRRSQKAGPRAAAEKQQSEIRAAAQAQLAEERAAAEALRTKALQDQRVRDIRNRLYLVSATVIAAMFLVLALIGLIASRVMPLRQRADFLTLY